MDGTESGSSGETEGMLSPNSKEKEMILPPDSKEKEVTISPGSRPRTVTCISVPEEMSPRHSSVQRSKSVRCRNQSGVICHTRSNSVVSRNGKRICKNLGRINSVEHHEEWIYIS